MHSANLSTFQGKKTVKVKQKEKLSVNDYIMFLQNLLSHNFQRNTKESFENKSNSNKANKHGRTM